MSKENEPEWSGGSPQKGKSVQIEKFVGGGTCEQPIKFAEEPSVQTSDDRSSSKSDPIMDEIENFRKMYGGPAAKGTKGGKPEPHVQISSQIDAVSYDDTSSFKYPARPGEYYPASSGNLPMDELEMKSHGLVDSHGYHKVIQPYDKDAYYNSYTLNLPEKIPFDELEMKQSGFIDPRGRHLTEAELHATDRNDNDPRIRFSDTVIDDTRICDFSGRRKSGSGSPPEPAYPNTVKFEEDPIVWLSERETLSTKEMPDTKPRSQRLRLRVRGIVRVRSRRQKRQ